FTAHTAGPRLCFLRLVRGPPGSAPSPYTTLFRSESRSTPTVAQTPRPRARRCAAAASPRYTESGRIRRYTSTESRSSPPTASRRSEEHTSELQSRENLVCRLLLEKKKHNTTRTRK